MKHAQWPLLMVSPWCSGVAYAPVSKSEDFTVRVPTGVQASHFLVCFGIWEPLGTTWRQDLKILVTASFAMMLTFNDPLEPKEIPFVQDTEKTEVWRGLTLQLDAGSFRVPQNSCHVDVGRSSHLG